MKNKKEERYSVWNHKENNYPFHGSWGECNKWMEENGNDIDFCVIP